MDKVLTLLRSTKLYTTRLFRQLQIGVVGSLVGAMMVLPTTAFGWDYSYLPLFWQQGIRPNVALVLDNSGSMQALVTNENYQRNVNNGTLPTTKWYWCTAWDTTTKKCSAKFSTSYGVDKGFGVLPISALTPRRPSGSTTLWEITLPNYIRANIDSATASAVALCNINKQPADAGFYLGKSGDKLTNASTSNLPSASDIGVLVSNSSSATGGTKDSCVRWKYATTGKSSNELTPAGKDYKQNNAHNIGTLYYTPGAVQTTTYGNFLLNTLVDASGSYNFDDDVLYPIKDSNPEKWEPEKDRKVIPNVTRLQAAREAGQKIVIDFYQKMNIGVFRLDTRLSGVRHADIPLAKSSAEFDAMKLNLIGATESLDPSLLPASAHDGKLGQFGDVTSSGTPLGETQNNINNYFKLDWKTAGGPIEYRCQKNYAVMMTDGEPSTSSALDTMMQQGYDNDARDTTALDADGKSFNDTSNEEKWKKQNIIGYTIGLGIENNLLKRAPLVNRVNVTKSDIKNNTIKLLNHGLETGDYFEVVSNAATGLTNGRFYYAVRVDKDHFKVAGANKDGDQTTTTANNVKYAYNCAAGTGNCLAVSNGGAGTEMVISTGPGKSFFAFTPEQLARNLGTIFEKINNITASASAVSTNTKQFSGDGTNLVYQARFTTEDWSGEVAAYEVKIDANGKATIDTSPEAIPYWTTKHTLATKSDRNENKLFTWNPTVGGAGKAVVFDWSNLSAAQKAALNEDPSIVEWFRGENVDGLRAHSSNGLMGDVINSDPVYLHYLDMGYKNLPPSDMNSCSVASDYSSASGSGCTGAEIYANYVKTQKAGRDAMIYVGSNGGMLHGLNAVTGEEKMAFIPNALFNDWDDANNDGKNNDDPTKQSKPLLDLTDPDYNHRYYVDGSLTAADVFLGNTWSTYLVGGLGRGGRSVFAIDVTDTNFDATDVKWEFTHPKLGYSYGQPIIARLADNNWYAIFPNGLDSAGDQARVFVVNLADPAKFQILETNTGSATQPNGMMSVQVRVNENRTVTDIYAADMRGNLWKFDVYNETSGIPSWPTVGTKLFTAGDNTTGTPQAITGGLRVGKIPGGLGSLIFFGTGKYFEMQDLVFNGSSTPQIDTFYAIMDDGSSTNLTRANLQVQTFSVDSGGTRTASQNNTNYTQGKKGWYIDLLSGTNKEGERIVSTPALYGGRVIFVSIIPQAGGTCGGQGESWLNELDALTGGMLDEKVLDTNGDGRVDEADKQVSSLKLEGMGSEPSITQGNDRDYKVIGSTSQTKSVQIVSETPPGGLTGLPGGKGRMSWKQLQ